MQLVNSDMKNFEIAEVLRQVIRSGPVVPVIVIHDLAKALPLAQALHEAGLRVLEITLRTPCAWEAIEMLRKNFPDMFIGAGTLRHPDQVRRVIHAGAQFAVSPGYGSVLAEVCNREGLALLPGIASAGELMQANRDGFYFVKLFPAEAIGGQKLIQSLASPFAETMFCPTGGINAVKAADYLALANVACVGGSWMLPADAIEAGDWARIRALASAAQSLTRLNAN